MEMIGGLLVSEKSPDCRCSALRSTIFLRIVGSTLRFALGIRRGFPCPLRRKAAILRYRVRSEAPVSDDRSETGSPNRTSGLILWYSLCSSQAHRSSICSQPSVGTTRLLLRLPMSPLFYRYRSRLSSALRQILALRCLLHPHPPSIPFGKRHSHKLGRLSAGIYHFEKRFRDSANLEGSVLRRRAHRLWSTGQAARSLRTTRPLKRRRRRCGGRGRGGRPRPPRLPSRR